MRIESVTSLSIPGSSAKQELTVTVFDAERGQIREGLLTDATGVWYPIIDGVPRLLRGALRPDFSSFADRHGLPGVQSGMSHREGPDDQAKTTVTFSDKWRRFKAYGLAEEHKDFLFGWYCKKLGLREVDELRAFYRGFERVLEVGPGSGFNTRFIAEQCPGEVFALDVSDGAVTTFENTRDLTNCTVVQADLMDAPFPDESFDLIIADGVLHHTPDTKAAVKALLRKLRPGGRFFFYVYKKMGPARQFSDAHIRDLFMKLSPEECYAACEGLTELGRELSHLGAKVTLSRPIPALGIPAGTHDVQRLIYYNFVKCFWNDAFDFETNNMVNFDWYHPHNAWQHTEAEVRGWMEEFGIQDFEFHDANPNGISCLLTKPRA